MSTLVGTTNSYPVTADSKIFAVNLTPNAGADALLKVYRGGVLSGDPAFTVRASGNTTAFFSAPSGIPFPSGFTVVTTNTESFALEFELANG